MRKRKDMTDEERIAFLRGVKEPIEALKAVSDNACFFGYDPYYGDIHDEVIKMVKRVVKENA